MTKKLSDVTKKPEKLEEGLDEYTPIVAGFITKGKKLAEKAAKVPAKVAQKVSEYTPVVMGFLDKDKTKKD